MNTFEAQLDNGQTVTVERIDSTRATIQMDILSEKAFAPGAPIRLHAILAERSITLDAKTIRSKRENDGHFLVNIRLISVNREVRALLASM